MKEQDIFLAQLALFSSKTDESKLYSKIGVWDVLLKLKLIRFHVIQSLGMKDKLIYLSTKHTKKYQNFIKSKCFLVNSVLNTYTENCVIF